MTVTPLKSERLKRLHLRGLVQLFRTSSSHPTPPSVLDLLKKGAEATALSAVLLYVLGWAYLYGYYKAFGLELFQLHLSIQEVMIFSLSALLKDIVLSSILLATLLLLGRTLPLIVAAFARQRLAAFIQPLLFCVIVFSFFYLTSSRAALTGREVARSRIVDSDNTLPYVQIVLDSSKLPLPGNIVIYDLASEHKYKLLLHSAESVWIFVPVESPGKAVSIIMIPTSAIKCLSIERVI